MNAGYIGNFSVPFTTENEIARGLEANGHTVARLQENEPHTWEARFIVDTYDVVLWTRTGWDWPHTACEWSHEEAKSVQQAFLSMARDKGVPVIGRHLDRWWGLNREGQVRDEPFFRVDLLVTADGGHDELWEAEGIRHRWQPPGVGAAETVGGTPHPQYASDIAFVGSWRPGYHKEWTHRPQLVKWLSQHYRRQVRFWPAAGQPAIRQQALRDLYASIKIAVGDSCLVGGATRYWSDRIPETLGRGAFLLHPYVEGIEEHYTDGKHLRLWPLGDWNELRRLIDYYLSHDDERRAIAEEGRRHVIETATYTVQMRDLFDLLRAEALL